MDKKFEKIYEIAEREGWAVSHHYESETIVYFLFSKFSPLGKDFNVEITVDDDQEDEDFVYENVCNAVYDFWDCYDVCEETYLCLDETGHGRNGAPRDMKDLYEDMQACEDMIHDLWLALEGKEKPKKTEKKQYVFDVFECDAWHSTSSMERKATCNSMEEAVNLIIDNGTFEDCSDKDYIRDCLIEYQQTQGEDVNYIISKVEVGVWE